MSTAALKPNPLAQRWAEFTPRERLMVGAMSAAVLVLLVWLMAVRPAWHTLSTAPALRAEADAQLVQMQLLASEARQLRALPPLKGAQAEQVLRSATQRLGGRGVLQLQGERATLTLKEVTGEDLRQWLSEARGGARARPLEMQLARSGELYSGTLVVVFGSMQ